MNADSAFKLKVFSRKHQAATYSRVEDVDGLDSSFAFLLEAEDQVDPLTQGLGDLVRLQGLSVDQNEQTGVVASPRG